MKLRLLTVSHKQPAWVVDGCADYVRRLPREWGFEVVEIKPEPRTAGASGERARTAEAKRIHEHVPKGARIVALDERGEQPTTEQFAARVQRWLQGGRDVVFVAGGADGLAPELRDGADERLSLSPLTLPHGLVRVVLAEQLYRASTLLKGHPYHR